MRLSAGTAGRPVRGALNAQSTTAACGLDKLAALALPVCGAAWNSIPAVHSYLERASPFQSGGSG
ncbi:MAG: hypothetical protein CMF59_01065 [Leptospiraceae bacterium]|nr:hypothetical protein [Leptospiraceae bacterium]